MSLGDLFDRFDEAIGRGDNAATLRAQLGTIREQVEAVEAQLQSAQTRVEELEANKPGGKGEPKQKRFDKDTERIIDFLFENQSDGGFSIELNARALGMKKAV